MYGIVNKQRNKGYHANAEATLRKRGKAHSHFYIKLFLESHRGKKKVSPPEVINADSGNGSYSKSEQFSLGWGSPQTLNALCRKRMHNIFFKVLLQ